jgi:AMMECR1 domain-containing protein
MFEPRTIYAKIAYDAILLYMKTGKTILKDESEIPPALKLKLPCYVSIFLDGKLRGSKGSIKPTQDYLYNEIIHNAVKAVEESKNAEALKEEELNNITLTVDVLSQPRPVENKSMLKPRKHGIAIKDEAGNESVVFPNTDGIESIEQQMETAKEKAGIKKETPEDQLNILNFTITRYQ